MIRQDTADAIDAVLKADGDRTTHLARIFAHGWNRLKHHRTTAHRPIRSAANEA